MKFNNITIEVLGARKSGTTTVANKLEAILTELGLTLVRNGDMLLISGEFPEQLQEAQMQAETVSAPLSILATAHQIVHGDREQTYGDAGKNFRTIAAYWNTHIKAAKSIDPLLTEEDVCGMMVLLKQARLANSPGHRDSLIDIVGYTELNDIIQQQKVKA